MRKIGFSTGVSVFFASIGFFVARAIAAVIAATFLLAIALFLLWFSL